MAKMNYILSKENLSSSAIGNARRSWKGILKWTLKETALETLEESVKRRENIQNLHHVYG